MRLTNYMYQEKMEKEDLPTLKTSLTHQYNDFFYRYLMFVQSTPTHKEFPFILI